MTAEEPAMARLARLIKGSREDLGWTQDDLAQRAGVSRPTVQRYETNKIRNPEFELLRRIFQALGLDVREIPVVLGLLTRAELNLAPEPARRFSATTTELIDLLEDPEVSDDEKRALVEFLRARRRVIKPGTKATQKRQAG